MERKVVISGGKYDGPDRARLKLHEEYGRVWLYLADEDGNSLQNGRLLCIDDDGRVRIHAEHYFTYGEGPIGVPDAVYIKWPTQQ